LPISITEFKLFSRQTKIFIFLGTEMKKLRPINKTIKHHANGKGNFK